MDYPLFHTDDVPVTDLSETAFPADADIRQIDAGLDADSLRCKLWYFEPGEAMDDHAHLTQEEVYHVLEGEFEVTLGGGDAATTETVGPGTWWIAKPEVGHGHRYVGEERGILLAIGAPAVDDEPSEPEDLRE